MFVNSELILNNFVRTCDMGTSFIEDIIRGDSIASAKEQAYVTL